MIISTTYMILAQIAIVTWIALTAPEPCPKEYLSRNWAEMREHCEITPAGLSWQWSLKEE